MNVIFLDIDGVMNSNDFYHRRHNSLLQKLRRIWLWIKLTPRWIFTGSRSKTYNLANYTPHPRTKTFEYRFKRLKEDTDPVKWKWLVEFCNRTDTKICISSVWKYHFNYADENLNNEGWDEAFNRLGFNDDTFVGITGKRQTLRGDEIKNWINQNNRSSCSRWWCGDVDKYAIIDDDSDMLPEQIDSFFHVDGYYGLSPNTLYRIGRHFNESK